jgi:hypothetical protein
VMEISCFVFCRRGLAAARELKLGELILRVPEVALINGKSARQDVELARVLALYPSLSDVQVKSSARLVSLGIDSPESFYSVYQKCGAV